MSVKKRASSSQNIAALAGKQTPLPMWQISCILFVQITEALNINVLFPFVAFMVEDMGFTGEALGYHAGLMAAAFCFAQFCTAVPWGMISDKIGRRPTIIIGTFGSGMGMLVFGLARTFPQAIAARIFSGLLSGNLGVVKSLLTEITDDTNRGAAFSYMSLAWAIGCVIAPLAGGMLCKPAEKYPSVFPNNKGDLFVDFPYLLPCLLCFSYSLFSAFWCICFMKETRKKKTGNGRRGGRSQGSAPGSPSTLSTSSSTSSLESGAEDDEVEMVSLNKQNGFSSAMQKLRDQAQTPGYQRLPAPSDREKHSGFHSLAGGSGIDVSVTFDDEQLGMEGGGSGKEDLGARYKALQMNLVTSDSTASEISHHHSPLHQAHHQSAPVAPKGAFQIGTHDSDEDEDKEDLQLGNQGKEENTTPGGANNPLHSPQSLKGDVWRGSPTNGAHDRRPLRLEPSGYDYSLDDDGTEGFDGVVTPKKHSVTTQPLGDIESGARGNEPEESDDDDDILCCSSLTAREYEEIRYQEQRLLRKMKRQQEGDVLGATSEHSLTRPGKLGGENDPDEEDEDSRPAMSTLTVLKQRIVILSTGSYGMLCAASILLDETLPLFFKSAVVDGGFGFDSFQIGSLLSISGAVMLVFTSFALPKLSGNSKFWMFNTGCYVTMPVVIGFPILALINRNILSQLSTSLHGWVLWCTLPMLVVIKNIGACLAFGGVMVQVNHSVTDEYLGAVNGLGQSLAALARAIGPAVGGALWSVSVHHSFVFLNFIVCVAVYVLCIFMDQSLPASIDFKRKPKKGLWGTGHTAVDGADMGAPQMMH